MLLLKVIMPHAVIHVQNVTYNCKGLTEEYEAESGIPRLINSWYD